MASGLIKWSNNKTPIEKWLGQKTSFVAAKKQLFKGNR